MALRSMTGYGRSQRLALGLDWSCEIRSVNHKGLEVRLSAPNWLLPLEGLVQQCVRQYANRGRIHVTLQTNLTRASTDDGNIPLFDIEHARAIVRQLEQLRLQLRIAEPLRLDQVLSFPGVQRRFDEAISAEQATPTVEALTNDALAALVVERDREGAVLADDFRARLDRVRAHVDEIAALIPGARDELFTRLRERVQDTIQKFSLGELSDERLWQEVVVYADRADITEEITRARAHIDRLIELIDTFTPTADGAIGKKMDFYFQELIRETNTMGSKSQHERIAVLVVENRSEIDRMREQILNVE